MGLADDIFRAHSPMGSLIAGAGVPTRAEPPPDIPEPPPTGNPFMSLVHGAGKVLGMARRPVDILAAAAAGLPDPLHTQETVGSLAKAALLPDEPTPSSIIHNTPLEWIPGAGLIGGIEGLREKAPKVASYLSAPTRAAVETGANLATDPLTYFAPGSRVASAALGGLGAVQAVESGVEAGKTLQRKGLTPQALEEATSAGLGLGLAGLGAKHALKGVEPAPVETPPEARVAERRVAEEPVPTERRVVDRRARLAEEFPTADPALLDRVHAAETDPLTGLPNKLALERDAAKHQGAVATFDIGGMKYINDNLGGHPAGDALLKAFGDALKAEPVESYRSGPSGDEFYLLADSPEAADAAAQRVRERFQNATFRVTRPDGQVVEYTGGEASHGVAPVEPGKPVSESIAAADRDLYERRQLAEDLGLRVPRGSKPRSLAEVPAGGEQVRGDLAAEGGEPQPPAAPALPAAEPVKPTRAFDAAAGVEALRSQLSAAKTARPEQERLLAAERSKRAGAVAEAMQSGEGEAAFKSALKRLEGEMPKAAFDPIRAGLSEEQVNGLYDSVRTAKLRPFEKVTAGKALSKLLDPQAPQIPQPAELALLERTFGPELVETIRSKRPTGQKLREEVLNIISIPRTLLSSVDMSAPLRQGLVLTVAHPLKAASAFGDMVKSFGSQKSFDALKEQILTRPGADLDADAGLYLSMREGAGLEGREEAFASKWIKKIPGIRGSERAYSAYLDKLRSDVFDSTIDAFKQAGRDIEAEPELAKSLATYINHATGRGDLGALNSSAVLLNSVFFSPRFMAARLRMFDPTFYAKMEPAVRQKAVGDMLKLAGAGVGLLSLAKMGGAEVESDPRSSDFGKIRFGKTRIDPWGGFQPWVRFAAQLATSQRKKLTGSITTEPRLDIASRFATQKLSPTAGLIVDILRSKTSVGEDTTFDQEAYQRLVPLFIQDVVEAAKNDPKLAVGAGLAGFFGGGVQTYDEPGTPTAMERYLKDEMERLGYQPEEPSSHTTVKGRKVELEPDEVRTLKKAQMKAADEARRVIRSSHYRRLSDTDRRYELERIFQKWRSRGHQRIQSGVKARYRDLPREPAGPQVGLGG